MKIIKQPENLLNSSNSKSPTNMIYIKCARAHMEGKARHLRLDPTNYNIIYRNVDKLNKKSSESHDQEPDSGSPSNCSEFCSRSNKKF